MHREYRNRLQDSYIRFSYVPKASGEKKHDRMHFFRTVWDIGTIRGYLEIGRKKTILFFRSGLGIFRKMMQDTSEDICDKSSFPKRNRRAP